MNESKVSICLTTYNRSDIIEMSIENIISQSYENFELFVVDDYSSLEHQSNLKNIESKIIDSRVTFIFNSENKGLSYNRNLVISKSTGKYFTFKDDDDAWHQNYLSEMINSINDDSKQSELVVAGYINKNSGKQYSYSNHHKTMYECFIDGITPPVGSQFYDLALIKSCGGYSNVKSGVDHDLWINIVYAKPSAMVKFISNPLVTPDSFSSSNNEKMTTSFDKRIIGINNSLILWEEKIVSIFSQTFYNHFIAEYNFYLCHRFLLFSLKKRDLRLLINVILSRKLSPFFFSAMYYLFKQLIIRRYINNFELTPLFRKFRQDI